MMAGEKNAEEVQIKNKVFNQKILAPVPYAASQLQLAAHAGCDTEPVSVASAFTSPYQSSILHFCQSSTEWLPRRALLQPLAQFAGKQLHSVHNRLGRHPSHSRGVPGEMCRRSWQEYLFRHEDFAGRVPPGHGTRSLRHQLMTVYASSSLRATSRRRIMTVLTMFAVKISRPIGRCPSLHVWTTLRVVTSAS